MKTRPSYRYPAAEQSALIRIISWSVIFLTLGITGFACFLDPAFFFAAGILMLIGLGCWLKQPIAYDWNGDDLIVHFRWGSKQRGPVDSCRPLREGFSGIVRLLGNGGVFAFTGLYWSKALGRFHAYLTTTNPDSILVVDRHGVRTLISPQNPDAFLNAAPTGTPAEPPSSTETSAPN
jgi:hypothetical protein